MTAKPRCIFCNAELDDQTKPEHILLSALGGRKTTRTAICSDCNNVFGGSIDKAFADQVEVIRNLLQLKSGTGKPPPMLRNVKAEAERVNFRQDGKPELLTPPFTVTPRQDGGFDVQVIARSEEHLKKILPDLAAKLRISEPGLVEMIKQGQAAAVERRPGRTHFGISLGGEEILRSVAKSCLVLFSTVVGNDAVRATPFNEAREFVRHGGAAFAKSRACIDSRELPGADVLEQRFGPFFNVIYVRSDASGRVIGHFTLYNAVGWQVILAEAGGPANQTGALACNPLNPGAWTDDAADLPNIPFEWLDAAEHDFKLERAQERLNRMVQYHRDTGFEAEVDRILKDVFERHGVTGDKVVTDPVAKKAIFDEFVTRVTAYVLGLPYQRSLGEGELEEIVAQKKSETPDKGCFVSRIVKLSR
jgi:hypothetical protein